MNRILLSPEQRERYFAMMDKYSRIRCLSREEKEDLILRITTSEYIDLMCDWAFKHVFGHNKDYLMMLLNDFLPVRIVGIDEIQYDPNEVDTFKGDDKQVIMDVLCHTETEHIIVEMQKSMNNEFRNRMVYYGGCMISRQLRSGDSYDKLKPVYVVCFMNFRLLHQTDQLVYRYQLREQDSNELYGDQLAVYLCELPRFVKESDRPLNPIEEWFELLQNMSRFVGRPESVSRRFDSILEDCRQVRLDALEQEQYFNAMISEHEEQSIAAAYKEMGFHEGLEKGLEKGRAEGIAAGKVEMARALKEMGFPVADICAASGLNEEVVAALGAAATV